jgi:succinyl-CoA synthetase alpha subunit
MSIFVNKPTEVITQGMTGETGGFHIEAALGVYLFVISAKAGTQTGPMFEGFARYFIRNWVPAFAGMTMEIA